MFSSYTIALTLNYLVRFINILILVRIMMSWIRPNPSNPIVQFVYAATEPILAPARNLIHNVFGYNGILDFAPIVAIFIVQIVYSIILRLL